MPRRAEYVDTSPLKKSSRDDLSEDNLLHDIPRPSVVFGEVPDYDDDPFGSPSKISSHAPEWVDLGLRELEARVSSAWDRADDLFADSPPRAAVVFLHANGDSGAGAQAWLSHAWATEDLEEYLAERCGAIVIFPDAPARSTLDVSSNISSSTRPQADSVDDSEDDDGHEAGWLDRSTMLWAPHSNAGNDNMTSTHQASSGNLSSKQPETSSSLGEPTQSMAAIDNVLADLYQRWPTLNPSNVLLGGFGAGGVLALHCALAREATADSAAAAARAQTDNGSRAELISSKRCDLHQALGERNRSELLRSNVQRFAGVFAFGGFLPATSPQWLMANVKWQRRPIPASILEDSSDEDDDSEDDDDDELGADVDVNALALSPIRRRQAQAARDDRALARAKACERKLIATEQRRAARNERREAALEAEEVAATVDPARWVLSEVLDSSGGEETIQTAAALRGDTRMAESEEAEEEAAAEEEELRDGALPLPVLLSHGENDEVVPHAWGLATARGLHLAKRHRRYRGSSTNPRSNESAGENGDAAQEDREAKEHNQGSSCFDVSFESFPEAQHELTGPAVEKFAAWVVNTLSLPSRNPVPVDAAAVFEAPSQKHNKGLESSNSSAVSGSKPLITDGDEHSTPEAANTTESQAFDNDESSKSSSAVKASAEPEMPDPFSLPYTVAKVAHHESSTGSNHYVATFQAPPGWADALCRHPVSARGASFIIERSKATRGSGSNSSEENVTCSFVSTAPKVTAAAIHARLVKRIQDPTPPGAEECSVM